MDYLPYASWGIETAGTADARYCYAVSWGLLSTAAAPTGFDAYVLVSNAWKKISNAYILVSNAWKSISSINVLSTTWKEV